MPVYPDGSPSVTVIIPTKNRASDLVIAVRSVLEQTVGPAQLVIVDQSNDETSFKKVTSELAGVTRVRLDYIRDTSITGLTAARNCAIEHAVGDIWLFLDDDVILEPEFIERLLEAYADHPDAGGISGIITNYRPAPLAERLWPAIFARGPFHDERQPIYWAAEKLRTHKPIPVRKCNGGAMSFRASAVRGLRFDWNLTGGCLAEDVDFSWRVPAGTALLIAPRARLVHNRSPVGRASDHWLRAHAQAAYYLYERNLKRGIWNRICFSWLRIGYAAALAMTCIKRHSLEGWWALQSGRSIGKTFANASVGSRKLI